jgi:hypothetical protein
MGIELSNREKEQLGSVRLLQNGLPSAHPFPSPDLWPDIRNHLVARSKKSNPSLDPSLTAYTPGETLDLLGHPVIKAWQEKEALEKIGADYQTLVLVPCAKTKPWTGPSVAKSKLYSAYNAIQAERPDIYFATISEPLGIVPMSKWANFPQYDNPGLFRDDAQQSGMTKKDWEASPFGRWYGLPFDEEAWQASIEKLGEVVGNFLSKNSDLKIISVVDNDKGPRTTHGAMLDKALSERDVNVERYPKRIEARVSPLSYLRDVIDGHALEHSLTESPKPSLLQVDAALPSPSSELSTTGLELL